MPIPIADNIEALESDLIPMNAPMSWEFLGEDQHEEDKISMNAPMSWEFIGDLVSDFHHTERSEIIGIPEAVQEIIEVVRKHKYPPPPTGVVSIDDPPSFENELLDDVVLLGADEEFPLTTKIYRQFRNGDSGKYVRLDTPTTYSEFRINQSPSMAELTQKVDELEALLRTHMSDGHGGQEHIVGLAEDISRLREEANPVDKRVPLSMPPELRGTWDCWREGDLICASIWLPGPDGEVRICTSATPVIKHVDDVVGCTHAAGYNVTELLGVLPTLACMIGGGSLFPCMAAAAPALLSRPEVMGRQPFIGRLVSANRPSFATLMQLFQHVQSGDPQAISEWEKFSVIAESHSDLAKSMRKASTLVIQEQAKNVA